MTDGELLWLHGEPMKLDPDKLTAAVAQVRNLVQAVGVESGAGVLGILGATAPGADDPERVEYLLFAAALVGFTLLTIAERSMTREQALDLATKGVEKWIEDRVSG